MIQQTFTLSMRMYEPLFVWTIKRNRFFLSLIPGEPHQAPIDDRHFSLGFCAPSRNWAAKCSITPQTPQLKLILSTILCTFHRLSPPLFSYLNNDYLAELPGVSAIVKSPWGWSREGTFSSHRAYKLTSTFLLVDPWKWENSAAFWCALTQKSWLHLL